MNNHSVISALLSARFEHLGVIDDNEPDYMELIEDSWYLGVICSENLLIAINNSEVWGLDCIGEADTENREHPNFAKIDREKKFAINTRE